MRVLPPLAALLLLTACASRGDAIAVPEAAGETPVIPEDAVEAVRTADNGDGQIDPRDGGEAPVTWFQLYGW